MRFLFVKKSVDDGVRNILRKTVPRAKLFDSINFCRQFIWRTKMRAARVTQTIYPRNTETPRYKDGI